ncbi:hypothetical protein [Sulfuracidifex tepidarius]|uniref:Uncharacterized protein n=1 Tax=Sulfuracidifex tepidarius TaxID=1294262 RepID=A0A510E7G5_9CREN|nr:hypothetical protein [Sulfuracidifex tepidarius]BBG25416.1 hypothetical protein IC006_2752 [Sulfuracidifex tepidarius]BBG28210.1 hypothetical protein IC007_2766 [Sulfuracidifex tepidarius]
MDSGIAITAEKLVDVTIKKACKIRIDNQEIIKLVGISSKDIAFKATDNISYWLTFSQNSVFYCKICNKGPFTKKGLYLHLSRLHRYEIKALLEEEIKREVRTAL